MKEKKAILFFSNFPPPETGQTIVTQMNYEFLKEIYYLKAIDTSSKVFLIKNSISGKFERLRNVFKNYLKLYRMVKRERPKHLYLVSSSSVFGHIRDWITILIARKYVDKITAHVHTGDFPKIFKKKWHQLGTKIFVNQIDSFLFLSESLAKPVSGYLRNDQIQIIPNTTEPQIRCTSQEIENKIIKRVQSDKFIITFLSNMIPSKGYLDLLHAIPKFNDCLEIEIIVNFIGNWPNSKDKKLFQKKVTNLKIENNIRIFGGISNRRKLKKILLSSDVFALPTYYPQEAQPISIIEAMNAAIPIISTCHASIPDYVIDDFNGYLVEKKSPKSISEALLKLTDKDNWENKALASRKMYQDKFSPYAVKNKLVEHFS